MSHYILDGKTPKIIDDLREWSSQLGKQNTVVKRSELPGGVTVSTVFLGLDHSYGNGPPVLFETMIFEGDHDGYQERYCTWEEAEQGHERAITLVYSV